jgi:plastocyanin
MKALRHLAAAALLLAAACGSGDRPAAANGRVIPIRLVTDEQGNRFDPEVVEARRGDVLRFTLSSGVHSIRLVTAGGASSALMQTPGEVLDVPLALAPGEYTFQCDPHVALGMVGRLTVR